MHLSARWFGPAERRCDFEDCDDFIRGGRSAGVPDAWVGEAVELHLVVSNQGDGSTAGESADDAAVTVAYQLPDAVEPFGYVIESDHPAGDRSSWARNDAMDNPANPPPEALPREGRLRLNGFSAGESKRVRFQVRPTRRTVPAGAVEARLWIAHLRNYYGEKESWDDPAETNDGQTFNGGDLRIGARLETVDKRAFLFDAPEPALREGWRACSDVVTLEVDVTAGALRVETDGTAPCVESPPLDLPTDGLPGLRVGLSHEAGPAYGRVEWGDGSAPLETAGDGRLEAIHIAPGWGPRIDRLRLYPLGDAPHSGAVRLDGVWVVAELPPPPQGDRADGGGPPPAAGDLGLGHVGDGPGRSSRGDGGRPEGDAGPGQEGFTATGGCRQVPGAPGWWLLLLAAVRRYRA